MSEQRFREMAKDAIEEAGELGLSLVPVMAKYFSKVEAETVEKCAELVETFNGYVPNTGNVYHVGQGFSKAIRSLIK